MKEIDPEVQALLDENRATLPDELVKEGWGTNSMDHAMSYNMALPPSQPSTEQQPIFDRTCVQCQRPITLTRGGRYQDHAGRSYCPADMIDERYSRYHMDHLEDYMSPLDQTEDEVQSLIKQMQQNISAQLYQPNALLTHLQQQYPTAPPPPMPPKVPPTPKVRVPPKDCSANKWRITCHHQCDQKDGHFGFHQCKTCHHLWR